MSRRRRPQQNLGPPPFRLLKLPYLAQKEIMNSMELFEWFDLSQCSQRMKTFLKVFIKKLQYTLVLEVGRDLNFKLTRQGHPTTQKFTFSVIHLPQQNAFQIRLDGVMREPRTLKKRKIGRVKGVLSHISADKKTWISLWKSHLMGARTVFNELLSTFTIHFEEVALFLDTVEMDIRSLLNWLNDLEPEPRKARIFGNHVTVRNYSRFLDNFKFSNIGILDVNMRRTFRKEDLLVFVEDLRIENAHWITLENIRAMNCIAIDLVNVSLTFQDINFFIRNLINGSHPNLEYIAFDLKRELDIHAILQDVFTIQENSDRFFLHNGIQIEDRDGHRFFMNSGEVGTIFIFDNGNRPSERIGIVVWKDRIH